MNLRKSTSDKHVLHKYLTQDSSCTEWASGKTESWSLWLELGRKKTLCSDQSQAESLRTWQSGWSQVESQKDQNTRTVLEEGSGGTAQAGPPLHSLRFDQVGRVSSFTLQSRGQQVKKPTSARSTVRETPLPLREPRSCSREAKAAAVGAGCRPRTLCGYLPQERGSGGQRGWP